MEQGIFDKTLEKLADQLMVENRSKEKIDRIVRESNCPHLIRIFESGYQISTDKKYNV